MGFTEKGTTQVLVNNYFANRDSQITKQVIINLQRTDKGQSVDM